MNKYANQPAVKPRRVRITDELYKQLIEVIMKDSVAELARRTRLPYQLIYNIVHKRVVSISARHFSMIFGKSPPIQTSIKADGTYFRRLVDVWLYLNEGVTKADLYLEFFGEKKAKKIDYRIFSGKTKTVDFALTTRMEAKFLDSGINRDTIEQWTREYTMLKQEGPVPYAKVRPLLMFIRNALGVHPTVLLNRWIQRYESGALKTVSPKKYKKIKMLKARTERALAAKNSGLMLDKLKEEIRGPKAGYTLYAQVREELEFLKIYAHKSPKRYLGRSTSVYERGKCKRLPTWRAKNISRACQDFVDQQPHLPLWSLPPSIRSSLIATMKELLHMRMAVLLSQDEGIFLEKRILEPSHAPSEYKKKTYGFTRFEMAGKLLGMHQKAFDLMVANNCDVFRKAASYDKRWYLSDLYLEELSRKKRFKLITDKYEWMSRHIGSIMLTNTCMN